MTDSLTLPNLLEAIRHFLTLNAEGKLDGYAGNLTLSGVPGDDAMKSALLCTVEPGFGLVPNCELVIRVRGIRPELAAAVPQAAVENQVDAIWRPEHEKVEAA